jgi:hypothetical protein
VNLAQLILFADANLDGAHKHCYDSVAFLDDFNDVTSSFVILEGNWQLFINADWDGLTGVGSPSLPPGTFGPGIYSWVRDVGVDNDAISSVRLV